jgi:hypothetical protein
MTVQTSAARPAGRSVLTALLGLVLTLVLFVVAFLAFVTVPLVLMGVGALAYLALRPRSHRPAEHGLGGPRGLDSTLPPGSAAHGFGSGAT